MSRIWTLEPQPAISRSPSQSRSATRRLWSGPRDANAGAAPANASLAWNSSTPVAQEQLEFRRGTAEHEKVEKPVAVEILQYPARLTSKVEVCRLRLGVSAQQIVEKDLCWLVLTQHHQVQVPVSIQVARQDEHGAALENSHSGPIRRCP